MSTYAKIKRNFDNSVEYLRNLSPVKTTDSLYTVGEHAVALLIAASVPYANSILFAPAAGGWAVASGVSLATPAGVLAVAYLKPDTYCDFQREYKIDANFVGGIEIALAAINYLYSFAAATTKVADDHGFNHLAYLNSFAVGAMTIVCMEC